MAAKPIYRVVFINQGKVYEVYARRVSQTGALFGFVEIEELVFDARKGVVVDPSEERLRLEFAGVKRTYLPMHYVLRIDEVDKQGVSKITAAEGGNVAMIFALSMPMAVGGAGLIAETSYDYFQKNRLQAASDAAAYAAALENRAGSDSGTIRAAAIAQATSNGSCGATVTSTSDAHAPAF